MSRDMSKRLTLTQKREIVLMYLNGYKHLYIANKCFVSPKTVANTLAKFLPNKDND